MPVDQVDDLDLDSGLDEGLDDTQGDDESPDGDTEGDDTDDDSGDDDDDSQGDDEDDEEGAGRAPLYKQAKAEIEKIRAENPKLAKTLQKALVQYDKDRRALPDGSEKAALVMRSLNELVYPGKSGQTVDQIVAGAKSELQGWRQFDAALSEGDPKVLDELAAAAPEAFQKLIPEALARYATVNPEAYSTMIAQGIRNDMLAAEVPMQMQLLTMFISQLPKEAVQGDASSGILAQLRAQLAGPFVKLRDWFTRVDEWAKKPIELKKIEPKGGGPSDRSGQGGAGSIEEREMNVRRGEWNQQSTGYGNTLISSETERLFGAKLTDKQRARIVAKVADELDARLAAKKDYGEAMRGFLQGNNLDGYKRRLHSEYKKLIPGAVARAGDDLKLKRVKTKAGSSSSQQQQSQQRPQQQRPQARQQQQQQSQEKPFELIKSHPRTLGLRIDLARTPSAWLNPANPIGKAIVMGGRRVKWKRGS